MLKQIAAAVDFGFTQPSDPQLLKEQWPPRKGTELMLKLLFLQYLYNRSDVKVPGEAGCNLAFFWFLSVNPEDELPAASLLCKFRRYRLKEFSLDEVITERVRPCVEGGLVNGSGVTVDSTHMEGALNRKIPERIMKHLAKQTLKVIHRDNGRVGKEIDTHEITVDSINFLIGL